MLRPVAILASLAVMMLAPGAVHAQAVVENALGVGRAATGTGAMSGVSKGLAGVFGTLDKAANSGSQSNSTTTTTTPRKSSAKEEPAGPAVVYEDPKNITVGMAYDEMRKRFGPPSMEIAGEEGHTSITYSVKGAPAIEIEVVNGKVASIPSAKTESAQSAVVVLK